MEERDAAYGMIKEGIVHSCIMGKERTEKETLLTSQAVKKTTGDLYFQTCKSLLTYPYNKAELAHLVVIFV